MQNLKDFYLKLMILQLLYFYQIKICEKKVLPSLIIIPLKPPSLIKVFEPAPNTLIFPKPFAIF